MAGGQEMQWLGVARGRASGGAPGTRQRVHFEGDCASSVVSALSSAW